MLGLCKESNVLEKERGILGNILVEYELVTWTACLTGTKSLVTKKVEQFVVLGHEVCRYWAGWTEPPFTKEELDHLPSISEIRKETRLGLTFVLCLMMHCSLPGPRKKGLRTSRIPNAPSSIHHLRFIWHVLQRKTSWMKDIARGLNSEFRVLHTPRARKLSSVSSRRTMYYVSKMEALKESRRAPESH